MNAREYIKKSFKEGTQISRFNILSAAVLGAPAHFFFYFVFKYGFNLPYESFGLRLSASLLSFFSYIIGINNTAFAKKIFPFYWHFSIIFVLPFIFTVYLLKNDFHELWLYWEIFMIFILIAYVPNWLIFLFDLLVGVSAAIVYFIVTSPEMQLNPDFNIPLYSIVVFFTIVAGYVFSYSNKRGQIALEKNSALQALSGSIAHEMRNPLGQVKQNLEVIEQYLPSYRPGKSSAPISDYTLDRLYQHLAQSQIAVQRGSQVITMILDEVREKPLDKSGFVYASATVITQKAIDEYGFESRKEKDRIVFYMKEDFMFRVDETMYIFVLFNLIMNALYFLKSYPGAKIYIALEKGTQYNRVKVKDTGPGIPHENLDKLFDAYFTSGRKGGTGLGLSYCKRIMHAFGGEITCDSVEGEFTEFTLMFPVISDEELRNSRDQLIKGNTPLFEKKRILVVDDERVDRAAVKDILTALGALIDEAGNGKEALDKISTVVYDLVIMNLTMPLMNGYEATDRIRKGEAGKEISRVPIVAYTAAPFYVARSKTRKAGMQGLITKPCAQAELVRQLAEIFRDLQDFPEKDLKDKSVLIADDSSFNRVALKMVLEKHGIQIQEAVDGVDAVNKLEGGSFDLVLMDIRMPLADGIEATRTIRQSHNTEISSLPVIGLSGDSEEGLIEEALYAGMNDYLIKPVDTKVLLKKISQWV